MAMTSIVKYHPGCNLQVRMSRSTGLRVAWFCWLGCHVMMPQAPHAPRAISRRSPRHIHLTCAEVGALDGPQVLLVGLAVARVLVEHEGVARLHLGLHHREPQLLGLNGLASPAQRGVVLVSDSSPSQSMGTAAILCKAELTCLDASTCSAEGGVYQKYN